MNKEEGRQIKRIRVGEEFTDYLFQHPDDYFVNAGLPSDAKFKRAYQDHDRMCFYFVYESEEWEHIPEGGFIPELDIDVVELYCPKCGKEMMWDNDEEEQYCPSGKHSRKWKP